MKDKEIVERIINSPYSWERTVNSIIVPRGLHDIKLLLIDIVTCKRSLKERTDLSCQERIYYHDRMNKYWIKINQFRFKHWDFRELDIKFKN